MNQQRISGAREAHAKALNELEEALAFLRDAPRGVVEHIAVDAVIKRFEVTFEYAWKLMKAAAEYEGSEAPGPRPAIQEALRYGWIDEPELWAEALDARNGSVHDYFGTSEKNYMVLIRRFAAAAKRLGSRVGATGTSSRKTRHRSSTA